MQILQIFLARTAQEQKESCTPSAKLRDSSFADGVPNSNKPAASSHTVIQIAGMGYNTAIHLLKFITNAPNGDDQITFLPQLAPQLFNMSIDGAGVAEVIVVPDAVKDLFPG